jgi:hypothetical protein
VVVSIHVPHGCIDCRVENQVIGSQSISLFFPYRVTGKNVADYIARERERERIERNEIIRRK